MRRPGRTAVGLVAVLATFTVVGTAAPAGALAAGIPAAPAPTAVVRVDQLGYPTGAPESARLMSRVPAPGARYEVVGGHGPVVTGRVGPDLGAWSRRYPRVYEIRFRVERPGSYRIEVSGPVSATSPPFRVEPAGRLYTGPLANTLFFYGSEQDGPFYRHSRLRTAPGHLTDEHAMTYLTPPMNGNGNFRGLLHPLGVRINASGGWWDAGDYLKFVETTSYVVALLAQGVVSFPHQMGFRAPSDFAGEVRFGIHFLLRMWNERSRTLYYQVGIGEGNAHLVGDHDIWRLPQRDDNYGGRAPSDRYIRHRPVFRAGPPGSPISPNLAGRLAADFALCFRVFRARSPALADRCLASAETVFALADTHRRGQLLTTAPYDFYPETSWQDDMELGATELDLAVLAGRAARDLPRGLPVRDPGHYLRLAAFWAHRYMTGPEDGADTLNLYDVSTLADYELSLAMRSQHARHLAVNRAELRADIGRKLRAALRIAGSDPFRFGFAWDQWDTTTHGAGLSVVAGEYDALAHRTVFRTRQQGWLDAILGDNAWGTSLIVGDGDTFPDCMQHQVANIVGSLDGHPPILRGAAVEGPNSFAATGLVAGMRRCPPGGGNPFAVFNGHRAVYEDNVQSYSTVEPAIDLTATTPLAFSWQVATAAHREPAP